MFSNNNYENSADIDRKFVESQINGLWNYVKESSDSFKLSHAISDLKKINDSQVFSKLTALIVAMAEDLKKLNSPRKSEDDLGDYKSREEQEESKQISAVKIGHYCNAVLASVRLGNEELFDNPDQKKAYLDLLESATAAILNPNQLNSNDSSVTNLIALEKSKNVFESTIKDDSKIARSVRKLSQTFVKAVVASLVITSIFMLGLMPTALLAIVFAPAASKKIEAFNKGVEMVLEKTNLSSAAKANKSFTGIFDEQSKKKGANPSSEHPVKTNDDDKSFRNRMIKGWQNRGGAK